MKQKDVQKAIKNLQKYLLDEYGWDAEKNKKESSTKRATPSEINKKLEAEYLSTKQLKQG